MVPFTTSDDVNNCELYHTLQNCTTRWKQAIRFQGPIFDDQMRPAHSNLCPGQVQKCSWIYGVSQLASLEHLFKKSWCFYYLSSIHLGKHDHDNLHQRIISKLPKKAASEITYFHTIQYAKNSMQAKYYVQIHRIRKSVRKKYPDDLLILRRF